MLKTDYQNALLDPADAFATPDGVLACRDLSRAQKIEILRRWEHDANEEAVAVEEGMPGGTPAIVRQVSLALERLERDGEAAPASPTKHGG